MEKERISGIVYFLLSLVIFRHVIEIIRNLISIPLAEDNVIIIMNICLGVIMITSLVLILYKKAWGVYLFLCLQIFSSTYNSLVAGDALIHIGVAAFMCVFLFLILQIREEGISAWSIIFKRRKKSKINEVKEKDNNNSLKSDFYNPEKNNESQSNETEQTETASELDLERKSTITEQITIKEENEVVQDNDNKQEDNQRRESEINSIIQNQSFNKGLLLRKRKKDFLMWFCVIVLMCCGFCYYLTHTEHLGKKVYVEVIEDESILHADRNCKNLKSAEYIDTANLNVTCFDLYCTECVSNTIAEEIDGVINRNCIKHSKEKEKENANKVAFLEEAHIRKERVNLYKYLSKEYELGALDDFLKILDNKQQRRKLYDEVIKQKLPLISYDLYDAKLGYGKYKSINWIFSILKENNYNVGSFEDFKASLIFKDKRDWYFEKLNICLGNIVSEEKYDSLITIED